MRDFVALHRVRPLSIIVNCVGVVNSFRNRRFDCWRMRTREPLLRRCRSRSVSKRTSRPQFGCFTNLLVAAASPPSIASLFPIGRRALEALAEVVAFCLSIFSDVHFIHLYDFEVF